jgi:NAD-dependent SIR2 family protein deacetylase
MLAQYLKEGRFKNCVVLVGAGISVAAGIPDFRTPGTGLYDNLSKYKLPYVRFGAPYPLKSVEHLSLFPNAARGRFLHGLLQIEPTAVLPLST